MPRTVFRHFGSLSSCFKPGDCRNGEESVLGEAPKLQAGKSLIEEMKIKEFP